MPRYTSPSSSTSPQRPSPRSHHQSLTVNSNSRRHHSPSPPTQSDKGKDALKTSLVFLGVIGATSLTVSKLWPKGILYGEKESWAQEAKEEAKRVMRKGRSDDTERHRRRPRSIGHDGQDAPRGRPPRAEARDDTVTTKPDGRRKYVDTRWYRHPNDGGSYRGRQRLADPQDSRKRDFDDDSYGSRRVRGSLYVDR
ncbi:hypothetical protein GGR54DRAFT_623661 [Hypoxylon sp. NC1633]|nr:hypothetical protein GGR54DRAFT_623661 [Hypoxylon sp. NC1633]